MDIERNYLVQCIIVYGATILYDITNIDSVK